MVLFTELLLKIKVHQVIYAKWNTLHVYHMTNRCDMKQVLIWYFSKLLSYVKVKGHSLAGMPL